MTNIENNSGVSKYEEFYCCYLLRSLAPKSTGICYIGSTNDPKRRLRQHNGEIALGAKKTIKRRPWEMVLFVYGFPNHVAALQFEWSWQHPSKTRRLHLTSDDDFRENDEKLSSSLRALSKMLQDKFWSRWPLHLHVIIPLGSIKLRHEKKSFKADGLIDLINLPKNIRVTYSNLEEFNDFQKGMIKKYVRNEQSKYLDYNTKNIFFCHICLKDINVEDHKTYLNCLNTVCNMTSHVTCLAKQFTKSEALEKATLQDPYDELNEEIVPINGRCPECRSSLLWGDLIQSMMIREKYVQNDAVLKE